MAADVQRELAEALYEHRKQGALRIEGVTGEDSIPLLLRVLRGESDQFAAALLPTVQALIADAEKRAAAQALRDAADELDAGGPRYQPVTRWLRDRVDALDPSGAADQAARR